MTKIPPRRIASDDCAVYVGRKIEGGIIVEDGETYYVHKDEYVEITPVATIQQVITLNQLYRASSQGDEESAEKNLHDLCSIVASNIVDWDWTDMDGNPLPKPHHNPDAIKMLTSDELAWLILVISGESPGERKNDSGPSLDS